MDLRRATDYALFLDLDGTLIDIAPTPEDVVVPDSLARLLADTTEELNGALAILTGRSIADADRHLAPLVPVAAGVHGAEIRTAPGHAIETKAALIDAGTANAVRDIACREPGALVEFKGVSIAIHYRMVPQAQPRLEEALQDIVSARSDRLMLCRGRKVLELVPRHVSKGGALEVLMQLPAFRGKRPNVIGDDLSDLSAFEAARGLGGHGYKVAGALFPSEEADFTDPTAVRAWLAAQFKRGA